MQRPDPPEDPPRRWWQQPRVAAAAGGTIFVLLVACAWLALRVDIAEDRRELLERQASAGFLRAPSSSRTVRVALDAGATVGLSGGDLPERLELRIAVKSSRFNLFRVAVARDDGTELLRADRLQRDTNGEIALALNSSLLPQGRYVLRVEGFTWRGETVPVGRLSLAKQPDRPGAR